MTQTTRLIAYLRTHPQATSLEITLACGIVNTTGRISDARAAGHVIECVRRSDGRQGYIVVDEPVQLQAFGSSNVESVRSPRLFDPDVALPVDETGEVGEGRFVHASIVSQTTRPWYEKGGARWAK